MPYPSPSTPSTPSISQKKWPLCKIVKVNTQATPDENNQIEVVRAKLKMTFDRQSFRRDKSLVDLDTLMRVFLNTRYIGKRVVKSLEK